MGLPVRSVAEVSGIGCPALAALRILARAATLIAMSRMIGSPPGFGKPKPHGLLPNRASLPPQGAMVVVALLPIKLANPAWAAM